MLRFTTQSDTAAAHAARAGGRKSSPGMSGGSVHPGAVLPDHISIPPPTVLHRPLLRLKIDVHQPEPHLVPERPLEVVEQRPDEIAAHRSAMTERTLHLIDMAAQVAYPALVTHPSVEVDPVWHADPVLGHQKSGRRVFPMQAHEEFVQTFGIDFPHL